MAQKRFTPASSSDIGEVAAGKADNDDWLQPLNQRARVFWYVMDTGYDIKVFDYDGMTLCHRLSCPPKPVRFDSQRSQ